MLIKVLGVLDLIIGLILVFIGSARLSYLILLPIAIILFVKAGIGLLKDFASWIDFSSGIIFILLIFFSVPWIICLIAGILLIQKGTSSFL